MIDEFRVSLIEQVQKAQPHRKDLLGAYQRWQKDYVRIFTAAGLEIRHVEELSNRYCNDDCCPHLPAVRILTQIGVIEFWWRKRVTVIDWLHSRCTAEVDELFPTVTDTADGRHLHCWSYDDAILRLTLIRESGVARDVMKKPNGAAMIRCVGCGFYVENEHVVEMSEYTDTTCVRCAKCEETPALRESYRRGFNEGLDAMSSAVKRIAEASNLRKRDPR